ncbi:cytochrome d ubiquinol oxidase subunit II [Fluviibacter phosphoraccumulans]|jgi:cytochrome d ubiquinol oxidase subunit II|uniref:Cytochrome d ubiquinol oxidase subunit II n=1 Tax=Fluviibacter phosphoraccumulans TaxID=1751046 RepID=A0A679I6J4_9RHOO|nr:cytochrome d ubiquinol oxidase subunit II [Fluviibacter phosphoraccumulans]BBU69796.1 cytochrome d ubiquinol oxidase subunit II [Fluviibacter phosphoraccumulans]BBU71021.1 cytochrome d ubiquinol oxidase subunit II [Fluviibacter phosphoraccumulans]BCA65624.1 cytochrome d ubiquinol oxidase subunit II [Fluviibacter phosphoraccumulans]
MFDYATLKVIWWLLVGVLLIGFAIMDGHDMGVGTLLPFVGKTDNERRVVINTVGPHWDGNQVWFITGGGAIFAAWPLVYATAFSGFYWAMLAVLWALFFRPVGFDYRSKIDNPVWRKTWDWGLFVGGAIPPLIFGVAFGNLLQGVPFHFDNNLASYYTGSFWALLNPFALLCGLVSTTMITFHGAVYLAHRTEGAIGARSRNASYIFGTLLIVTFSLAGIWLWQSIPGYVIETAVSPNALPNPLGKSVIRETGAWLQNYQRYPLTTLLPLLVYVMAPTAMLLVSRGKTLLGFIASSITIIGVIGTAGVSMFPFIMPSSTDFGSSLTVWDSVSSHLTLGIMLVATLIFMPIIIIYTSWAYKVMAGKVTLAYIRENDHSAY